MRNKRDRLASSEVGPLSWQRLAGSWTRAHRWQQDRAFQVALFGGGGTLTAEGLLGGSFRSGRGLFGPAACRQARAKQPGEGPPGSRGGLWGARLPPQRPSAAARIQPGPSFQASRPPPSSSKAPLPGGREAEGGEGAGAFSSAAPSMAGPPPALAGLPDRSRGFGAPSRGAGPAPAASS